MGMLVKGPGRIGKANDRVEIDLAFYKFALDSLPVGIFTVNPQLEISSFNPWAEWLTGYSEKEALGCYCGNILQGGI